MIRVRPGISQFRAVSLTAVCSAVVGIAVIKGNKFSYILAAATLFALCSFSFTRHPRWVVPAALTLLPLPLYFKGGQLHAVIVPFFIALLYVRRSELQGKAAWHRSLWWIIGFIVWTSLLVVGNGLEQRQILGLLTYVLGIGWMWALASSLTSSSSIVFALKSVGGSAILINGIALLQYVHPGLHLPGVPTGSAATQVVGSATFTRLAGPLNDFELFGEYLAIALVVQLWLASYSRGRHRVIWLAAAGGTAFTIALTGTRGALLQLAVEVLVLIAATGGRSRRRYTTTLATAGLGVIAAFGIFGSRVAGVLGSRLSAGQTSAHSGLAGLLNRDAIWRMFFARTGLVTLRSLGRGPSYPYGEVGFFPHSIYFFLALTVGTAGMVLFVGFILHLLTALIRRRHESTYNPLLVAVLCGFLVNEVKIEFARYIHYQLFIWSFLAIAIASASGGRSARTETVRDMHKSDVRQDEALVQS